MKTKLLFFFILQALICHAQNKDYVWCFGDSARIDFINGIPIAGKSVVTTRGTCASICDSTGNLLFYSATGELPMFLTAGNGKVYNRNDTIMQNGDSLPATTLYNENIILPYPNNPSEYILFSLSFGNPQGLYYSIIDMNFNAGLGKLTQKQIPLFQGNIVDAVTAIKHGNGRDWWLVCTPNYYPSAFSDTIYVYGVSPNGIAGPDKYKTGTLTEAGIANLIANRKGDKVLYTNLGGLTELFDFNRCTGEISNVNVINNEQPFPYPWLWGSCFSPNDSLFYISRNDTPAVIVQYDMYATNIAASADTIAYVDGQTTASRRTAGAMKLGPDGKIYVACTWLDSVGTYIYPYPDSAYYPENMYLGVIENPNIQGSSCNWNPYGFYLGGQRCYAGLPNNPNYELGPLVGSACDTLTAIKEILNAEAITISPNPTNSLLKINGAKNGSQIKIYNTQGNLVLTTTYTKNVLDVKSLTKGMYLLQIIDGDKNSIVKFAKE